jgi:hypothetical protein
VPLVREQEQPLGGKEENESTEHGGTDHHDCPQALPERSGAQVPSPVPRARAFQCTTQRVWPRPGRTLKGSGPQAWPAFNAFVADLPDTQNKAV